MLLARADNAGAAATYLTKLDVLRREKKAGIGLFGRRNDSA
jgi:hypothetical protein